MSGSSIFILIVFIVISALSKSQKQKEAQKKRAQQAAAMDGGSPAPAPAPVKRKAPAPDDRFPTLTPRESRPKAGSISGESSQSRTQSGSMLTTSLEGVGSGGSLGVAPEAQLRHTVKPMTEGSHSHMESSITGISAFCPPDAPDAPESTEASMAAAQAGEAYTIRAVDRSLYRHFAFDQSSVRQGFLYGIILGPPKALRR